MNLSPAYLKRREDWKEEGKQEGRQEGTLEERYSMIASLLEGRFGTLDSELSSLVERIAQLPISERTGLLLLSVNLADCLDLRFLNLGGFTFFPFLSPLQDAKKLE